ncbi:MAG TPA: hypothetical protein VK973_17845 [Arenicellales bacterium]|nr:hypothetical protein [Arenicellales bacterium]
MKGSQVLRVAAFATIAAAGGMSPSAAQQGSDVPPGLYSHTIQHETYLQQGSQTIDVPAGRAAFADGQELEPLDVIPDFLANDRTPAPDLAGSLRGCGIYEGSPPALSDQPLQSDFERFDRQILDEIDGYLAEGYPPASVLMHAASMGVSIDRALYAAVRSRPLQADNLYTTALELMAFLPGWTCTTGVDHGLYDPVYDVNDLPEGRLIQDVAARYFQERARLSPFPDWPNGEFHMLASADELLELLSAPQSDYWYQRPARGSNGAGPRSGVLIGLYPDSQQIVVDTSAERIRQWRDQGRDRIPVTFFYNFDYQVPVSRFGDDASLEDIMASFFGSGTELTPVPQWNDGDHHLQASAEELEDLFELPEAQDIEPQRYRELTDELAANGFNDKPVLVTLLSSGRYSRVAEPDRIRVALEQGIESFPVTVFFHRLDREACGAPAICFDRICDALVCAGGDPNICLDPAAAGAVRESSFNAPPGGGGGGEPPPDPPPPEPASPS